MTKALEDARAQKLIGHSLNASVKISASKDLHDALYPYKNDLSDSYIVSNAALVKEEKIEGAYESRDMDGLSILVEPAPGDKCERCWKYDSSVGKSSEHPTICSRCEEVLQKID